MERVRYFEDYEVGEARETLGRTITETDMVIHAGHSGDFFPHHMDAEFCKTQPFGQRIAHGTMTFAIGIGLQAAQLATIYPQRHDVRLDAIVTEEGVQVTNLPGHAGETLQRPGPP